MSDPFTGKTWWLIGASEGLGRALAVAMDKRGARLILSARSKDPLRSLASGLSDATVLPLDVTDRASVNAAWERASDAGGVLYCVGAYEPMPATAWDADAVEMMIETNFTGAVRVLSHAVPAFATRGQGRIMLIGSLSGYRGLPDAIGYGASKAALMHLAENLLIDLKGTGVTVQMANPGFINTRLTKKNAFKMPQLMQPDTAADHVIRAIDKGRFETAFPRPFSLLFTLGRFLPRRLFNRLFA
ncbi:SDR family NAD(P)-dependent oxidoreductase [Celeribacter sp.]|uniref:SDR family NAD(P)-dependent oxidoreductase n=1 Tax=Celeribacter sp. TaxID=1890673 RepID=UPI003A9552EA